MGKVQDAIAKREANLPGRKAAEAAKRKAASKVAKADKPEPPTA